MKAVTFAIALVVISLASLVASRLAALWNAGQDLPVLLCGGLVADFVILVLIVWASRKHPSF